MRPARTAAAVLLTAALAWAAPSADAGAPWPNCDQGPDWHDPTRLNPGGCTPTVCPPGYYAGDGLPECLSDDWIIWGGTTPPDEGPPPDLPETARSGQAGGPAHPAPEPPAAPAARPAAPVTGSPPFTG